MTAGLFHGILPPITTPFDATGAVDHAALERNLDRYESTGLAGYVLFGSNGEAVHLDPGEQQDILDTVLGRGRTERPVVVGINELSTRAAIGAVQRATDAGAAAALVITPYFYKGSMGQDVLRRFFLDVADATELPILAYNVPKNTGVTLDPATVAALAEHPRIVGCKDSSGNLGALVETLRLVPDGFQVLVGNAGILYPALAMGATGGILAVACVAPDACVDIHRAVREGRHTDARALQERLAPLGRAVTVEHGIAGLKASLDLAGWAGGDPRRPLPPLDDAGADALRRTMAQCGFFPELS